MDYSNVEPSVFYLLGQIASMEQTLMAAKDISRVYDLLVKLDEIRSILSEEIRTQAQGN